MVTVCSAYLKTYMYLGPYNSTEETSIRPLFHPPHTGPAVVVRHIASLYSMPYTSYRRSIQQMEAQALPLALAGYWPQYPISGETRPSCPWLHRVISAWPASCRNGAKTSKRQIDLSLSLNSANAQHDPLSSPKTLVRWQGWNPSVINRATCVKLL